MSIAIKVENLSKAYQLGEIGTGTLSNDLKRWAYKVRGKEDPFLKIGETNDRTTKGESDIVWSLKDLNFEIEQGDAVGIIGRNGAGKSTLLKILSRVTSPTTGSVKVKGRVASLLEVGTGFHPELTGRENIFLNGAILGMRKAEIKKHFDAIVDFAGVERYIDTPVKRYSSGMYVRLAFAVAAHLESEILVVDEVLAVGDAEFQKKCLGKMGEVNKGEGRTVLFVSHNISAVKTLCKSSIVLNNGKISIKGTNEEGISYYFNNINKLFKSSVKLQDDAEKLSNSLVLIHKAEVISNNEFSIESDTVFNISFELLEEMSSFNLSLVLLDNTQTPIFNSISPLANLKKGKYIAKVTFPYSLLNDIHYSIRILLVNKSKAIIDLDNIISWKAIELKTRDTDWFGNYIGVIRPKLIWQLENE